MRRRYGNFALAILISVSPFAPRGVGAQAPTGFFSPGGRTLFELDLASTPIGSTPAALEFDDKDQSRPGRPTVVMKDGKRMLKAIELSEFVVRLGNNEKLPEVFTLEFDIIPKKCCQPEDLSFEGTRKSNRGAASAHVVWYPSRLLVVGGGETFEMPVPDSVSETLPNQPTTVAVSMNGGTLSLFTNGRLQFTLNNRKFIRGNLLRVFLGARVKDDGYGEDYAVYLSRLRIAEGGGVVATAPAPPSSGTNTGSTTGTTGTTSAGTGSLTPPIVPGVSATFDAQGKPTVSWRALQGASGYVVVRWLLGDAFCCNNTSPADGIPALTWQDVIVPKPGNYGFRVYATTPTGIFTGETQAEYKPATATVGILQPIAGSQPVPIIATIKGPDTALAVLNFTSTTQPFGVIVAWTNVPGATAYRVYRTTPTETGAVRGTVKPSSLPGAGGVTVSAAVDAEVIGDASTWQYYVEAVFADGSRSEPSPVANVTSTGGWPSVGWNMPLPFGLVASVGGPMTITFNGQETRGSRVTWTWDTSAASGVTLYFISVDIAAGNTPFGPAWMPYRSGPVQVTTSSPIPYLISGVTGPPYSLTLPAGWQVRFCVSYFPVTDLQRQNGGMDRSGCTVSQLPP